MKQGMGVLVRKPPDQPPRPTHCPWCGCKWGIVDLDQIKCGSCLRELK